MIAGEQITYTIIVTNNGPSTAQSVDVKDDLPAGISLASASVTRSGTGNSLCGGTVCQVGDMALNEVVTITVVGNVDSGVADGTVATNTATVFSDTPDPVTSNNSDTAATTVNALALLTVSKHDLTDPVGLGELLAYEIVVTNSGSSDAQNVSITDVLDANTTYQSNTDSCVEGPAGTLTCSLGTVTAGAVSRFLVTVLTADNVVSGTVATNNVTLASSTALAGGSVTTASEDTTLIQKFGPPADLSIAKTAAGTVVAGELLTYTIVVTNNGTATATGVRIVDALPDGTTLVNVTSSQGQCVAGIVCELGDLAVNATATVIVTVRVDADQVGASLTNTALVSGDQIDPVSANNGDTADTSVTGSADLSVLKTVTPNPAVPGESVTYQIVVNNAGPSDAAGVNVADSLPAGVTATSVVASQGSCTGASCSLGTIPAGGSATVTIIGAVDSGVTAAFTNTATVSSVTPDPVSGNNTDTAASDRGPVRGPELGCGRYAHGQRRRDHGGHLHGDQRRPVGCRKRGDHRHLPGQRHRPGGVDADRDQQCLHLLRGHGARGHDQRGHHHGDRGQQCGAGDQFALRRHHGQHHGRRHARQQ